jgi:hypothetical protein
LFSNAITRDTDFDTTGAQEHRAIVHIHRQRSELVN